MKINYLIIFLIIVTLISTGSCKKDEPGNKAGILQLVQTKVGTTSLKLQEINKDIAVDKEIMIEFSSVLDTNTVRKSISLKKDDKTEIPIDFQYNDEFRSISVKSRNTLEDLTNYILNISSGVKGLQGETFPGVIYQFTTVKAKLLLESITLNGFTFSKSNSLQDIDNKSIKFEVKFSLPLDPASYKNFFTFSENTPLTYNLTGDNKIVTITNTSLLKSYTKYYLTISGNLASINGNLFEGFSGSFYSALDSTPKFPIISDDALLELVQKQTFKYFWDFGHPACGLTRERNTAGDVVTIGGSGFGVMAIIIGIKRGYITRNDGLIRMDKILGFLEKCDRYHGVWPHWLNGSTGKIVPFSPIDDGGDIVETSYMIEGLLTMRQFLDSNKSAEKQIIDRINKLSEEVEYDWYTQDQNVLWWLWSPNHGWDVKVKVEGYNETLITYVVAASSTAHPISADVYKKGYTRNGSFKNGKTFYGYKLPLGEDYGGPLFFTHYTYLGLDPRHLQDEFANYWEQNVNHALIDWSYCVANPKKYVGYSSVCWGLTASDNQDGYSAHSPLNDLGVITPSAAVSSIPYSPKQSMDAIRHFYYILGDKLWGEYGFYDAFNVTKGWWASSYIAIDQGPIICMIENYRTGLLWELFMSSPEIKKGLDKLGFTY